MYSGDSFSDSVYIEQMKYYDKFDLKKTLKNKNLFLQSRYVQFTARQFSLVFQYV